MSTLYVPDPKTFWLLTPLVPPKAEVVVDGEEVLAFKTEANGFPAS